MATIGDDGDLHSSNNNNNNATEEDVDPVDAYRQSLSDLVMNSKPHIVMLTMLAEESKDTRAVEIVDCIEQRLLQVNKDIKLPTLYLIDSICKNVRDSCYLKLFQKRIVKLFCHVFEKSDEKTRLLLYKLRQTWNTFFSADILYRLDVAVKALDPGWPIVARKPIVQQNGNDVAAAVGGGGGGSQSTKEQTVKQIVIPVTRTQNISTAPPSSKPIEISNQNNKSSSSSSAAATKQSSTTTGGTVHPTIIHLNQNDIISKRNQIENELRKELISKAAAAAAANNNNNNKVNKNNQLSSNSNKTHNNKIKNKNEPQQPPTSSSSSVLLKKSSNKQENSKKFKKNSSPSKLDRKRKSSSDNKIMMMDGRNDKVMMQKKINIKIPKRKRPSSPTSSSSFSGHSSSFGGSKQMKKNPLDELMAPMMIPPSPDDIIPLGSNHHIPVTKRSNEPRKPNNVVASKIKNIKNRRRSPTRLPLPPVSQSYAPSHNLPYDNSPIVSAPPPPPPPQPAAATTTTVPNQPFLEPPYGSSALFIDKQFCRLFYLDPTTGVVPFKVHADTPFDQLMSTDPMFLEPKQVYFSGHPTKVIIDPGTASEQSFCLNFNNPTPYLFHLSGIPHPQRIMLGLPDRELIVNDRPYKAQFGGAPVPIYFEADLQTHLFLLSDSKPFLQVSDEPRYDLWNRLVEEAKAKMSRHQQQQQQLPPPPSTTTHLPFNYGPSINNNIPSNTMISSTTNVVTTNTYLIQPTTMQQPASTQIVSADLMQQPPTSTHVPFNYGPSINNMHSNTMIPSSTTNVSTSNIYHPQPTPPVSTQIVPPELMQPPPPTTTHLSFNYGPSINNMHSNTMIPSSTNNVPTTNTYHQHSTAMQHSTSVSTQIAANELIQQPSTITTTQAPFQQQPTSASAKPALSDLGSLLSKLSAAGLISNKTVSTFTGTSTTTTTTTTNDSNKMKKAQTTEPKRYLSLEMSQLKQYHQFVINQLYNGLQCTNCSLRFPNESDSGKKSRYSRHLDWHFRQNRREKIKPEFGSAALAHRRPWYYTIDQWILYKEVNDDIEENNGGFFDSNSADSPSSAAHRANQFNMKFAQFKDCIGEFDQFIEVISCDNINVMSNNNKDDSNNQKICSVVADSDVTSNCTVCNEPFKIEWYEDEEEWRLINAVCFSVAGNDEQQPAAVGRPFHPLCLKDHLLQQLEKQSIQNNEHLDESNQNLSLNSMMMDTSIKSASSGAGSSSIIPGLDMPMKDDEDEESKIIDVKIETTNDVEMAVGQQSDDGAGNTTSTTDLAGIDLKSENDDQNDLQMKEPESFEVKVEEFEITIETIVPPLETMTETSEMKSSSNISDVNDDDDNDEKLTSATTTDGDNKQQQSSESKPKRPLIVLKMKNSTSSTSMSSIPPIDEQQPTSESSNTGNVSSTINNDNEHSRDNPTDNTMDNDEKIKSASEEEDMDNNNKDIRVMTTIPDANNASDVCDDHCDDNSDDDTSKKTNDDRDKLLSNNKVQNNNDETTTTTASTTTTVSDQNIHQPLIVDDNDHNNSQVDHDHDDDRVFVVDGSNDDDAESMVTIKESSMETDQQQQLVQSLDPNDPQDDVSIDKSQPMMVVNAKSNIEPDDDDNNSNNLQEQTEIEQQQQQKQQQQEQEQSNYYTRGKEVSSLCTIM
ncbi:mRNA 3' end processing factor [Dermatophagoides farinae]|uniref:mRNA 3' end processing factor n=1 Tax=Dermatophagoides farinae TaxID=6954 RepID=A0A922HUZ0_DERFA|nr:mRNA 3' end processing factor [Dermatophagoides farinae]